MLILNVISIWNIVSNSLLKKLEFNECPFVYFVKHLIISLIKP